MDTMSGKVKELIDFIVKEKISNPNAKKGDLSSACCEALSLEKKRSVFFSDHLAVRFSEASGASFSNVVLSLSALKKFDHLPFIVVVVRPKSTEFLIANSTFLKKISHSSKQLRVDNVKGSFLGHDIIREFHGFENKPENFASLFDHHLATPWDENLSRLVEATSGIVPTGKRFEPTPEQMKAILKSPELSYTVSVSKEFLQVKLELDQLVQTHAEEILQLAKIDNVNVRGNRIEQLLTGGDNRHEIDDMNRQLSSGIELLIEVKTKLLDKSKSSNPKAYNIDKMLEKLSSGYTAFVFLFIGMDIENSIVTSSTISIFDESIIAGTKKQHHWAGRNSRGATQLTGETMKSIFSESFQETIDRGNSKNFLRWLMESSN